MYNELYNNIQLSKYINNSTYLNRDMKLIVRYRSGLAYLNNNKNNNHS